MTRLGGKVWSGGALPGGPLGMFIFDDNKETFADIEKSVQLLRGIQGTLRLNQIVEKGFFIDSTKSLPLQLCDLFTLSLRKMEECRRIDTPIKSIDASGIEIAKELVRADNQHDGDVLEWLKSRTNPAQKRSGQGNKPRVG